MTELGITKEGTDIIVTILIPLVAALLGGLAGAGISIFFAKRQARQEYRSLILSFSSEMVSIFQRCVMYYRQSKEGQVSFSALFSFIDSSALSRFASVCQKPEVVAAIIELKSVYFQVQRHVEEASRFALEGSRTSDAQEKQALKEKARHAQGTALVFFRSSYRDIEEHTALIVRTSLQLVPGRVSEDLSSRFSKAKKEKEQFDQ
ncbi:MAG: hypothetical protein V3T23_13700, partial [Nitrososphaerales archaeon]